MNELIVIQQKKIGNEKIKTVDARELHSFLEVSTRFNDWIANRIEQFEFSENQDFVTFTENLVKGRPSKEYHLSLDMAKELSMVERNEKGKLARQYFIECEKNLKALDPALQLANAVLLANKMIEEQQHLIEQKDRLIADVAPKAQALDLLENCDGNYNLTTAAKILNIPPQKFIAFLCQHSWIYRMGVTGAWTGHQDKINVGYLVHKIYRQELPDGTEKSRAQVLITPKGMARLAVLVSA